MTKRRIFSSIGSFLTAAKDQPALLNVDGMVSLKPAYEQFASDSQGCGCKKNSIYRNFKGVYEGVLSALSDNAKKQMKSVLNTEEICYYVNNASGQLELKCF